MKNKKLSDILNFLPLMVVALLVVFGFKTFIVWSQITYYIGYTLDKNDSFVTTTLYEQKIISDRPKLFKLGRANVPKNLSAAEVEKVLGIIPKPKFAVEPDLTNVSPLMRLVNYLASFLHSPRALLMSPTIILGDNLKLNMHRLFSFQVLFILFFFILVIRRYLIYEKVNPFWGGLVSLMTCGLSLMMNGRMIFPLLGGAFFFLMVSGVRNKKINPNSGKEFLLCGLFLFLSSVSTGVFSINYFILLGYLVWELVTKQRKTKDSFILGFILLAALPLFYLSIRKNLLFFGGDFSAVWRMMNHGFGKVLIEYLPLSIAFIVAGALALFYKRRFILNLRYEYLAFIFGVMGGVFGYSTTTAAIVPLTLLLILIAQNFTVGRPLFFNPTQKKN